MGADKGQFICAINSETSNLMIWTTLIVVISLVVIVSYIKKKDLFISLTAGSFSAFAVSLVFRLYNCTVTDPMISTKYVIAFFVLAIAFGALVKAQGRNSN